MQLKIIYESNHLTHAVTGICQLRHVSFKSLPFIISLRSTQSL
jgi:hypothetical protein